MIDDRDPLLTRLFAEQDQPDGRQFAAHFVRLMERDWRARRSYRMSMLVVGVIVVGLLAPSMTQFGANALGAMVEEIGVSRSLLNYPLAWLMAVSGVASFLPVVYLGITRRW